MPVTVEQQRSFVAAFSERLKARLETAHLRVSVIPISGWWEVSTHKKNSPRTLYATLSEAVDAGRKLAKELKGRLTVHQENIHEMFTEDYSKASSEL